MCGSQQAQCMKKTCLLHAQANTRRACTPRDDDGFVHAIRMPGIANCEIEGLSFKKGGGLR